MVAQLLQPRSQVNDGRRDGNRMQQEMDAGEQHQQATSTTSLTDQIWKMKECMSAIFMYNGMRWITGDIMIGFLRSIETCEPRFPSIDKACPLGSIYDDGLCSPVPPGEPGWSGSAHCVDQNYVVSAAVQFSGRLSLVITFAMLIGDLVVGTTLVDTLGRKPMIVWALIKLCLIGGAFTLVSQFASTTFTNVIIIPLFVVSLFSGAGPASAAMLSDLSPCDEVQRSRAMTLSQVSCSAGTLCAFIFGFYVLRLELEDYSIMWIMYSLIALLCAAITAGMLHETLPVRPIALSHCIKLFCDGYYGRRAFHNASRAFGIVWQDPYVRNTLLIGSLLANVAICGCMSMHSGWAISICGYTQAVSSVMGIVQPMALICGSLVGALIVPATGPHGAGCAGLSLVIVGYFVTGAGAFFRGTAPTLFWCGTGILAGFGQGIVVPCFMGVWSSRIANADQGKLFAVNCVVTGIGSGTGSFVFSNFFFANGPTDTGLRLALGWWFASALLLFVVALAVQSYFMYIVPEQRLLDKSNRKAFAPVRMPVQNMPKL